MRIRKCKQIGERELVLKSKNEQQHQQQTTITPS